MKKLLLIFFLLFTTLSFAQQNGKNNTAVKKNETPITLTLINASPNPFISKTNINFQSTKEQLIEFTVKNLLGKTVFSEQINAKIGSNTLIFDRNEINKGMYIYTLQTTSEVASKRLVIQ